MVLKSNFPFVIQDFDILGSFIFMCCDSANACGFDTSQFPSNNMFAAAGEQIWDNGAACGRQYQVTCTAASAPAACIPGQTITITIVDRALTLTSQPSKEGTLMVLSRTAFQAIAATSASSINIDFKQ